MRLQSLIRVAAETALTTGKRLDPEMIQERLRITTMEDRALVHSTIRLDNVLEMAKQR